MANFKAAAGVLRDYGQRSTLHGLSHMYQSGDIRRRAFWVVLTFSGCAACFYHIFATVSNFLESPVTSIFRDEGADVLFPDVTICNLKPVSETLLHTQAERRQLFNHLEHNWHFFRDWLPEQRKRGQNESRVDYKLRQRDLFQTYMDVFWASDDTRDFGMSDHNMLLSCLYKGRRCDNVNFKLIQHNRYWNCYTFLPTGGDRTVDSSDHDSGLQLIMFTDSNFDRDRLLDQVQYRRKKYEHDELHQPYDLEEYLSDGDRTMNQVLTGNNWEAEGLRIFVHRSGQHHVAASIAYDISNGAFTTIEFSEVQVNALNSPPEHVCNENAPDLVPYVRYFGDKSTGVGLKNYSLTQSMAVIEAKQRLVYKKCGCYSHLLPFRYNTSVLCLFAHTGERLQPSQTFLDRIRCHTAAYKEAEGRTASLMQENEAFTPCTNWKLHAIKTEVPWPRSDELIDFVNYIVLPRFRPVSKNGSAASAQLHHLREFSNSSRADSIINNMFNVSCRLDGSENLSLTDSWCLSRNKLMTNVARIWIKPDSPRSAVYLEDYSYDWPEALSEIGGIFGLWMGISLLSVCEFIELAFILVSVCSQGQSGRGGGGRGSGGGGGGGSNGRSTELEAVLRQMLLLSQRSQRHEEAEDLANLWASAAGGFDWQLQHPQQQQQQQQQQQMATELMPGAFQDSPTNRRPMRLQPQQQHYQMTESNNA